MPRSAFLALFLARAAAQTTCPSTVAQIAAQCTDPATDADNLTKFAAYCTGGCRTALEESLIYCGNPKVYINNGCAGGANMANASSRYAYCDICTQAYYEATQACSGFPETTPSDPFATYCTDTACTYALQKTVGLCANNSDLQYYDQRWVEDESLMPSKPSGAAAYYLHADSALQTCIETIPVTTTSAELFVEMRALRKSLLSNVIGIFGGTERRDHPTLWETDAGPRKYLDWYKTQDFGGGVSVCVEQPLSVAWSDNLYSSQSSCESDCELARCSTSWGGWPTMASPPPTPGQPDEPMSPPPPPSPAPFLPPPAPPAHITGCHSTSSCSDQCRGMCPDYCSTCHEVGQSFGLGGSACSASANSDNGAFQIMYNWQWQDPCGSAGFAPKNVSDSCVLGTGGYAPPARGAAFNASKVLQMDSWQDQLGGRPLDWERYAYLYYDKTERVPPLTLTGGLTNDVVRVMHPFNRILNSYGLSMPNATAGSKLYLGEGLLEMVLIGVTNKASLVMNVSKNANFLMAEVHSESAEGLEILQGNLRMIGVTNMGPGPIVVRSTGTMVFCDTLNYGTVEFYDGQKSYMINTDNMATGNVKFSNAGGRTYLARNYGNLEANGGLVNLTNSSNFGTITATGLTGFLENMTNEASGVITVYGGNYTFNGRNLYNYGQIDVGSLSSSGRRRTQSGAPATTKFAIEGGVSSGPINIGADTTFTIKLDKNDGAINIASGSTGTVELGDTSTVTSLSGDGAGSVTVTQYTSTNPTVTGVPDDGSGGNGAVQSEGDAPCFGREETTACRLVDASVSAAAAYSHCFGASPTEGVERVRMSTLVSGDTVLSGAASTTRVVVNQHTPQPAVSAHLLTLRHAAGYLALTPDHVLLVDGAFAPARTVTPGSTLSGGEVVERVSHGFGAVINPITVDGKILAAGLEGQPVVAATANEWAADALLSPYARFSLAFSLSAAFPQTTQQYYDEYLEPIFNAAVPLLARTKASSSTPFVISCFAVGDLMMALGFVAFSLIKPAVLLTTAAALVVTARRSK